MGALGTAGLSALAKEKTRLSVRDAAILDNISQNFSYAAEPSLNPSELEAKVKKVLARFQEPSFRSVSIKGLDVDSVLVLLERNQLTPIVHQELRTEKTSLAEDQIGRMITWLKRDSPVLQRQGFMIGSHGDSTIVLNDKSGEQHFFNMKKPEEQELLAQRLGLAFGALSDLWPLTLELRTKIQIGDTVKNQSAHNNVPNLAE